ncbi:MAG: AAA family ATPase, partial [Acidobacteria bacterium]|nr:AAA family ATPase [Acidobacteriota bacterium]
MRIRELQITNFRSLKNLKTPSLPSAVVFHGANNSGKSNILLALQTIFAAKSIGTGLSLPQEVSGTTPLPPERKVPFWQGVIFNFSDNFYMGTANLIDFSVRLEVPASHFAKLQDVNLLDGLLKAGHESQMKLVGRITRLG